MSTSWIATLLAVLPVLFTASGCENAQSPGDTVPLDEYVHARASWSPDGRTIAFTSLTNDSLGIYLIDSSGANLRQILSGDGIGVSWSPDGEWLAFARNGFLTKMKSGGDSLVTLSSFQGAIRPAWSNDGTKIAFVDRDAGVGIWMFDVSTSVTTQLLAYGNYPSWHPTSGELVVFDARYDINTGSVVYKFLAVTPSTGAVRTVGTFATLSDCGFSRISPAGNAIVYTLKRPDDLAQVWVFDINLSRHTRLTDDGGDLASWNADGSKIVYTRTQPGDGGLWLMNADGSAKRRLTRR